MLRRFATGQYMTPDIFMRAALDRPMSPWSTFAGAAKDAALSSPGLGSVIREGMTPDPAREPVAGGRGGVRWRDETPQEVEARGDRLYQSEEEFKASPSWRPDIPFERGMTESRARALADFHDVAEVRRYYGQKRPVTAFFGSLVGAAADPINYIPIAGEAAAAWTTARVGRIAGRALIGGADAAVNTALFGALTAPERARFGDDVSWQAIMAQAGFAAMAGAVIGGGIGAFSRFRDRGTVQTELGDLKPNSVTAKPNSVLDAGAERPALSISGETTARFEPVRTVTAIDRLETVGNRIKAADVMNDAVHGLVNDGEVRLGERSQGHVADMQAALRSDRTISAFHSSPDTFREYDWSRLGSLTKDNVSSNEDWALNLARLGPWATEKDLTKSIGGSVMNVEIGGKGKQFGSLDALEKAIRKNGGPTQFRSKLVDEGYGHVVVNDEEFGGKSFVALTPGNFTIKTTPSSDLNFSAPKPDAPPAGLQQAYSEVTVREKPAANPEKALIDRAVADAKEEGFDPATGTHDLEPDIEALRNQGVLDAEDEKALSAADETYQGATAWEEVMTVARTCVLS